MNNETKTIITCCIGGCDQPATHHADHEHASLYCEDHGVCTHCGLSVEHFEHVIDQGTTAKGHHWSLDVWLCPCVADRRRAVETQREIYEPKEVVEMPKKTVVNYWSKTA
jgi:hypothetical protein